MGAAKKTQVDPFYVIFEQHLFNSQDMGTEHKAFVQHVVQDYLSYLRKHNISVPRSLEDSIIEELSDQIHTMLVKKIYGFYSLEDYQKSLPSPARKRAKARYTKLKS